MRLQTTLLAVCLAGSLTSPAFAWGSTGHRLISRVAIEELPASLPAFVRSADAIAEIGALGPEADRLKGSGKSWDQDNDHAHFIDLNDDGSIAGTLSVDALPPTRESFDTALRAVGSDQYKVGYVPYEILDGYEVVVTDFAYWRADAAGEQRATTAADKAYFAADRRLRETLTLRDIGYWSHFVGDASQPLHASVHYNGWGNYPNPNHYSDSHSIHSRFETALVKKAATEALVASHTTPFMHSDAPIETRVAGYLRATLAGVPRVYTLEAAGGIDTASPDAVNFMLDRLAAGASMLRDLTADAWTASEQKKVGYPAIAVSAIENGTVVITKATFGGD